MQPCPYCGGDTRINKFSKRIGKATPTVISTAQIKCTRQTCGMSGPLFKGDGCAYRAQFHWDTCIFHPSMRKAAGPEMALRKSE